MTLLKAFRIFKVEYLPNVPSTPPAPPPEYLDQLVACQSQLYGYIMASVCNAADTADILQLTNITLWENFETYDPEKPFMGWAITTARFQIMSFLRDRKREPLVFDTDVIAGMQLLAESEIHEISPRLDALRTCLAKLKPEHRNVLAQRYAKRIPLTQIAENNNRSVDGVKGLLKRLRKSLGKCIDGQIYKSQVNP